VEDDSYFKREGNDIYTKCSLTISQAVLGTKLLIKTLKGFAEISVDKGTMDGDKKKLANLVKKYIIFFSWIFEGHPKIEQSTKSRKSLHYI